MSNIRSSLFQGFSLETTAKDVSRLLQAKALLPTDIPVNIAFISSESYAERLAAVEALRAVGARPRPIISARRITSPEVLRSYLTQAVEVGQVRGVFLVGGDPAGPQGPFTDSMDVINGRFLDGLAIETVGIPGYPEGHPRITDEVLWDYLRRKVDALTAKGFKVEITTQLSFDTDAVIRWIEQVRQAGIHVPIRVGIPSPSNMTGLLNFARQCRVGTSAQLLQRYGWQVTSLLGTEGPERFLTTLLQRMALHDLGELHLHIYTLGDISRAIQWFQDYEQRTPGLSGQPLQS